MDSGILFIMIETTTIRRCIKGDRKAQKQVYVTCAPYVYTIVKSYIYNHADIKDVMQEVFAAIFFKMDKFNPQKGNFKSWISSIATYKAIDFLKAKNKIQFEYELEILEDMPDDSFKQLSELSVEEIHTLLEPMPTGYRTIFLLNIIDEYTHKEIAEMLEISVETSRSQLHRALKWIKKNLINSADNIRYEVL